MSAPSTIHQPEADIRAAKQPPAQAMRASAPKPVRDDSLRQAPGGSSVRLLQTSRQVMPTNRGS